MTAGSSATLVGTALLCGLGAWVGGANEAAACDCAGDLTIQPNSKSGQVPTNSKIWIDSQWGCNEPSLRNESGQPVEVTQTTIGPNLRVLHPSEPLKLGSSYAVACEQSFYDTSFEVDAPSDSSLPELPSAIPGDLRTSSLGDSCGDWSYLPMQVSHDAEVMVLDVAGRADLDAEALSGEVVDVFMDTTFWFVGSPACDHNWSFDDDGDPFGVRFASFDLAGNFSGWSRSQDLSVGCGCEWIGSRQQRGKSAFWLAVVLTIAAAARGRRRRS